MTVPVITPLPPAPTRADAPSDFTAKADAFVAAQARFVGETNALAEYVNERATGVGESVSAAQQSAEAAQQAEAGAAQQVALAADEVVKAAQQVEAATEQADRATEQANAAQNYAAAAGAAAGLPALAGNGGKFMQVLPDETGVRWVDVKPQRIGDILISARGSVEGYLEAVGGIYLQAAYPELYAELGLLGGERGLSWDSSSIATAAVNTVEIFVTKQGTIIQLAGTSTLTQVIRSTDGGVTWSAPVTVHATLGAVGIAESADGTIAVITWAGGTNRIELRHSLDDGATWSTTGPSLTGVTVKPAFFVYSNGRWVVGGFASSIVYLTDVNASGFTYGGSVANGSAMVAIAANDTGVLVAAGGQHAFVSINNGNTWTVISTAVGLGSARLALSVATDKKGKWVITGNGFTSRSVDDRATWEVYEGTFSPATGKTLTDGDGVWVNFAGSANVRRSVDDGKTWNAITPVPGANYANNPAAYHDGNFYFSYRPAQNDSRTVISRPSYGYDTATQFRLPNIPVASGLKAFIKAQEIAA